MRWVAITLFAMLAACAETQQVVDDVARQSAKAAVDEVIVTRFPGVDGTTVTPYTDCVIDNATGREIGRLAQAALVGVTDTTVQLVFDIARRPETSRCLLEVGLKGQLL